MKEKSEYFEKLYNSEIFHHHVFDKLASIEKDAKVKSILEKLSKFEVEHSRIWKEIPGLRKRPSKDTTNPFLINAIGAVRRVIGLELTIKIMEYEEVALEAKLHQELNQFGLDSAEKRVFNKIKKSEERGENPLKDNILKYSAVLNNIRSIVLGMNDGLVEILGAVSGFAVALRQPLIVVVAGSIVAIAGTLSMAGGSYLSIEYEKSLYKKKNESSTAAALYTGIAYIIGSAFPLIPFIFGLTGYYAIALSVIVTAIVLTFASTLISVVSDTSISQRIIRTLLISLGIVAVSIALGIYARNVLHINI
jgi:vacuolar iron transporter family protein